MQDSLGEPQVIAVVHPSMKRRGDEEDEETLEGTSAKRVPSSPINKDAVALFGSSPGRTPRLSDVLSNPGMGAGGDRPWGWILDLGSEGGTELDADPPHTCRFLAPHCGVKSTTKAASLSSRFTRPRIRTRPRALRNSPPMAAEAAGPPGRLNLILACVFQLFPL